MRFKLKENGHNIRANTRLDASVCDTCKRMYFLIEGKSYAWVDGCKHNKNGGINYVTTYFLSNDNEYRL